MLRFSANLGFLWPDRPLLARIEAAADAGFPAIELHWPYDTPAEAVRAACDRRGLTLTGLNTAAGKPGEFGLGALAGREGEFRVAFAQAAAYARTAGAGAVHAMAGVVQPEARAAAFDVLVGNLRAAASEAPDLTLLLEPINPFDKPDYFYSRIDEATAVLDAVGASNVKLMFDAYHVGRTEGDVLARLARAMPRIGHVQIAAVPSRAEPDEGDLDYRAVFDTLERFSYGGWVGCEYKPRADTDAGLVWTEHLGVKIAG